MKTVLSFLVIAYLVAFAGIRIIVGSASLEGCELGNQPTNHTQLLGSIIQVSDRLDHHCIALRGFVGKSGHPLFDLLFIRTYQLRTRDGQSITLFTHGSTPMAGEELVICGEFRQFFHGVYFTWLGVLEQDRVYLDEANIPTPQ